MLIRLYEKQSLWVDEMTDRGLFVGRFQPFHLGHLGVIKDILKVVDELVIVIGSAQYSHTLDNPFTAGERLVMLHKTLEESNLNHSRVWIVPVPDVHLHMMWVSAVEGYTPKFDVVYSNEPLTRRLFIEAEYPVESIRFHKREVYSSTEIRQRMINDKSWTKLVPKTVAKFIRSIGGVNRLQDLNKSDKV